MGIKKIEKLKSDEVIPKKCTCGRSFHSKLDYVKSTKGWRKCARPFYWFECECQSTLVLIPKENMVLSFYEDLVEENKQFLDKRRRQSK